MWSFYLNTLNKPLSKSVKSREETIPYLRADPPHVSPAQKGIDHGRDCLSSLAGVFEKIICFHSLA